MFKSAAFLSIATIAGLVLGFCREWMIIHHWGISAESDTLLVALFLPEAVRTMLGSGLLSAAALPLWASLQHHHRTHWLRSQVWLLLAFSVFVCLLLTWLSPFLIGLIGLGLAAPQQLLGQQLFEIMIWTLPGMCLQSLLAVPLQADQRYVLAGMGSFLFNLLPVVYLSFTPAATLLQFSYTYVAGSFCMLAVLLPDAWQRGVFHRITLDWAISQQLLRKIGPLLTSSLASQGLFMLERVAASLIGPGTITVVNFARKLTNLPLIALMSLNQVLLSKMSQANQMQRMEMLSFGMSLCTLICLPASLGMISAAPALSQLTVPAGQDVRVLSLLLACFAPSLLFGSWNALLARYYYANHDTLSPLRYELAGSLLQAMLMLLLSWWWGVNGLAFAVLAGVMCTAVLLAGNIGSHLIRQLIAHSVFSAALLGLGFVLLYPVYAKHGLQIQLMLATVYASAVFAVMAWRLKTR